jgi:uncharacterized membrane protein YqjE
MEPTQQNLSLSELLTQLVSQIEHLLKAHLRLAREEITADGRNLAVRAGGLVFAGILGIIALVFLGVAMVEGLTFWLAPWLAALLVSLFFFALCSLIGYQSLQKLRKTELTHHTQQETQETIAWLRGKQ